MALLRGGKSRRYLNDSRILAQQRLVLYPIDRRPSAESEGIAPGVVLIFDEQEQVVSMEIEDAGQQIDLSRLELKALPISSLLITERVAAAR
jgi:hypothetical protein